jgi:hypothetical protein
MTNLTGLICRHFLKCKQSDTPQDGHEDDDYASRPESARHWRITALGLLVVARGDLSASLELLIEDGDIMFARP